MLREGLLGAIAGATGTLALDAVGYGDMLLRGRAASGVPAKLAGRLGDALGIAALATGTESAEADHRRAAAGAQAGYALGIGVGGAYGLLRSRLGLRSPGLAGIGIGMAAMTASDASYALSGVSDPRTWTAADWLSDIVPHLIYGLVTVAAYETIASQEEEKHA